MNISKLKRLVESSRLDKVQIAQKCGISPQTLYNVLAGADAKISTIESIADVLNISVSELYEEEQPAPAKKRKGCGEVILSAAEALSGGPSKEELQAKIDHLEEEIASARRQMDINYRYITMLEQQLGIEQPTEKNTATA